MTYRLTAACLLLARNVDPVTVAGVDKDAVGPPVLSRSLGA
jgi:hypothetical protein